ncbi:MAG: hypothetical protein AB7N76_19265 [Planctomycetota bacterium]
MLEKLIATVLTGPAFGRLAKEELERLQAGGYLPPEEVAGLLERAQERLGTSADRARALALPLLREMGATLREALDIPSRAEIRELTEALRARQEGPSGAGASAPEPDPPQA